MSKSTPEVLPLLASGAVAGAAAPRRVASGVAAHVPPQLLGVALVAGSAFTFSLLSTLIKVASVAMPSMETVFWRSVVAWALNLAAIQYYKVDLHVAREFWRPLATRCLIGTCAMSLGFYAIQQMVLADASVLLFTSPIWTFFLGALVLSERIDAVSLGLALVSFVGVVFVSRPTILFGRSLDETKTSSALAIACALLSAVARSVVYVSVRQLQQLHFMVVIHYYLLTTTVISALWLLLVDNNFVVSMAPSVWLAVLGAGFFGFIGQLMLTRGFQLEKAGIAAVMRNLDVVFVFIWDLTLLGERISLWSVAGAAIICGCAILIARRRLQS